MLQLWYASRAQRRRYKPLVSTQCKACRCIVGKEKYRPSVCHHSWGTRGLKKSKCRHYFSDTRTHEVMGVQEQQGGPVMPGLVRMSVRPPAATATTGKPEAMASRATNPRVSLSLGIMNTSPLAYAADNSSPLICPYTCVSPVSASTCLLQ